MTWRPDDPQGDEAGKIKHLIVPYTRGVGLDLGCGPKKAFPHFIGVDSCKDTELFGIEMRPDVVVETCERLDQFEDGQCDFVFSSHLLEHIEDYRSALAEWMRVIKPSGHLVLYLPHRALYPNIGMPGSNPDHKHDFTPGQIIEAMEELTLTGWDLLVEEARDEEQEYSFLQVYRKRDDRVHTYPCYDPPPEKTVCVVRYGGFGDQIQASNILPELKRQGYHVTFMTTPKGQDILREDPHIDAWIIQDDNQVPNFELGAYFEAWEARFDKWTNLCESVEGTLLAMPGRANHLWPTNLRRKVMGRNYLEFTAELAELPYRSEASFYATQEEREKVARLVPRDPAIKLMMFALSGSSVHKFYPWQDVVIQDVLDRDPDAHFVLVGDMACKILEAGWEEHPRVTCLSGEISIRETLTLAMMSDCVVGPETGVLNAVAFHRGVRKVCLLSHSSAENLTKHWVNSAAITPPESIACYPCHRLHYDRRYCFEHADTGASMCQVSIAPADVVTAILGAAP
jgi:ADP-heptose:LPS heptosyltransferase/predicted SAM-dependent methyltransferase